MCKIKDCNRVGCKKYGGYCSKHRREYLIHDDLIIYERFTKKESDYLKKDIQNTMKYILNIKSMEYKNVVDKDKLPYEGNKTDIFWKLKILLYNIDEIDSDKKKRIRYLNTESIELIKKIQNNFRKKKNIFLRGIGYIDKKQCNNDSDFFTYEKINEINDKYFFSYRDDRSFVWFFDIRSFNKLIEMKQNNPYTRETIPENIIQKSKELSKLLCLTGKEDLFGQGEIVLTKKQIIKQNVVDIFSQMEQYGYSSNTDWFYGLNIHRLKKLYRSLEDIWNYRLDLSNEIKSSISPPNGLVFNIPISQVCALNNQLDVQEVILNEVMKFNNAINTEYKKLGYMYFLLGLGTVSKRCYESHQWLMYVI